MSNRRSAGAGADIDGLLLVDKPIDLSSNQVLQQVRQAVGARRAGHTGTLDLKASGLLAICLGRATRLSGWLLDARKRYVAEVALGVSTTTGDAEGEVVERVAVGTLQRSHIEAACQGFLGESTQVPPMYSALKRAGRPLYSLARAGQEVEREARTICIHELQLLEVARAGFTFEVSCSKGTYVRTLAEDIGRALGLPAHLAALRRTAIGSHRLEDAVSLPDLLALRERGETSRFIRSSDSVLADLPALQLDATDVQRVVHGQPARAAGGSGTRWLRLYADGGDFLGVGERRADGLIWPRRLLGGGTGDDAPGRS